MKKFRIEALLSSLSFHLLHYIYLIYVLFYSSTSLNIRFIFFSINKIFSDEKKNPFTFHIFIA